MGADANKGLEAARRLAAELDADHPDAAASLREGLEDMFTARRIGVSPTLAKSLTNTNCIVIWSQREAVERLGASRSGRTAR